MSFRVLGTGMYVPPRVVTNDDLSQFLETNDEWITQRVGVKERHISTNETAADMGAKAAMAALENSGVAAEEIDLILAASVSGESISPSVSCMIQNLLGLSCMRHALRLIFFWKRRQGSLPEARRRRCSLSGQNV